MLDAAIEEFQRAGTSSADINAIVEKAGVSRSTFYFHFPTKEHVLVELLRRDEDHLSEEFSRFLDTPHDLPTMLAKLVQLILALESRWGASLFRDVTGMLFTSSQPEEQWIQHPTFMLLAAEIERARHRGDLYADVSSYHSAAFFLTGIYALLSTNREFGPERDEVLGQFVKSALRSLLPAAG